MKKFKIHSDRLEEIEHEAVPYLRQTNEYEFDHIFKTFTSFIFAVGPAGMIS